MRDEHVLLVSKPAGMLTQKAKPGDLSLNEYAIGYLLREGAITRRELQTVRPSVCNRLDRNTSGIVAIGKTVRGLQALSAPLSGPNGQQALSGAGLRGSEERPEN
jgi:23S rRNA pseudouridine955/2504/2580 synthase